MEGDAVVKRIDTIFSQPLPNGREGVLGIDEDCNLYWNGREVITKQELSLQWWVNIALLVASASTAFLAFLALLEFLGYGSI